MANLKRGLKLVNAITAFNAGFPVSYFDGVSWQPVSDNMDDWDFNAEYKTSDESNSVQPIEQNDGLISDRLKARAEFVKSRIRSIDLIVRTTPINFFTGVKFDAYTARNMYDERNDYLRELYEITGDFNYDVPTPDYHTGEEPPHIKEEPEQMSFQKRRFLEANYPNGVK